MKARVYYSDCGWIIDTPVGLSPMELARAIAYHKKIQSQRIAGMRGDKREQCAKALSALTPDGIKQNILPNRWNEYIIKGEL